MDIKKREEKEFYPKIKRGFNGLTKFLLNKKTKIFFILISIIIVFLIGSFFGLLISGFFGSFDKPSERAINLLSSIGIKDLKGWRNIASGVLSENVKIPFNYVIGQFSKPEKIYIDIAFKDYQKIEYTRQRALEQGVLITSDEDYAPATIRYKDKTVDVNLRLKGDLLDHIEGKKWSFRIKVKGNDTLFGMKTFSIQDPKTRNYLGEFVYYKALEREDILSPNYDFIDVVVNGKNKGIYALEEFFEKQLIEDKNKREGVIIEMDESLMWEERADAGQYMNNPEEINNFIEEKTSDWFYSSNIDSFTTTKTLKDPVLSKQFSEARNLLESFRNGELKTSQVFDVDILARYFAINTVLRAEHGSIWGNIRFYYNPITGRLEPIGYDATSDIKSVEQIMNEYMPDCISYDARCSDKAGTFYNLIFRDEVFFNKYMKELERVSKKEYIDELFSDLNKDINRDLKIIHKDNPFYHFPKELYYINQEEINRVMNPRQSVKIFLQKSSPAENRIMLYAGNIGIFPLEFVDLVYNKTLVFGLESGDRLMQPKNPGSVNYKNLEFIIPPGLNWSDSLASNLEFRYKIFGTENIKNESILPWSYIEKDFLENEFIMQEPIGETDEFFDIDNSSRIISIKKGIWILNQSIVFPPGFSIRSNEDVFINLINGAVILSYSDLQFRGTEDNPIKIISSDKTGGIAILNARDVSNLEYVRFSNLTNPSKGNWGLTGAITFYESPFVLENVVINGMKSEDSLNAVRSRFEIRNSIFNDCFSDCFDDDFSEGVIDSSSFFNSLNDGIDISGARVNISNTLIYKAGDKGISAGEGSDIQIINTEIKNSNICVGSKDLSNLSISSSSLSECNYGFAIYQKKSEFGPASITAENVSLNANKEEYIVEKKSNFIVNGKIILGDKENVYNKLYPMGG